MKVYNTLTRQKEEFKTITPGKVKMYACGPTVYNYIHIGNARPMIVFDVLRSYLEYRGNEVTFVQNFTDVDDKIINKAKEEGVSAHEISERFIAEYQKDAKGLNVREATVHPKVTENMDSILEIVKTLVDKGYAYEANGDVYFRTHQFKDYGKLSHMPLEDLESGARIAVGEQKEDPMDFALWKAAKPGEPSWPSPWGEGRPGWHIECSAMSRSILGETIDLHCGGQDLIFPHHENEIAQSECASGKIFANYWMHNGYINVDNRKMSKSLGNFFTVREVAEKFGYEPIRFMMLQAHYRSPINYSLEIIEQCKSALERLYNCKELLARAKGAAVDTAMDEAQKQELLQYKEKFIAAMDDDLNTADAIAAVFDLVREINSNLSSDTPAGKEYVEFAEKLFLELTGVLGLLYQEQKEEIPQEVMELVSQRAQARKEKDFKTADALRDQILALGYEVKETRQGVQVTKTKN
ncbi:Cysteine--tRNA ligase [uncultured Ruminococcus sp.]|nr:Cysteine--tRNA ligase [uncultured Ruminococcus sp.]SCH26277.1 Cysteine--tRNA ligase [uncultured Clostridium sp.]